MCPYVKVPARSIHVPTHYYLVIAIPSSSRSSSPWIQGGDASLTVSDASEKKKDKSRVLLLRKSKRHVVLRPTPNLNCVACDSLRTSNTATPTTSLPHFFIFFSPFNISFFCPSLSSNLSRHSSLSPSLSLLWFKQLVCRREQAPPLVCSSLLPSFPIAQCPLRIPPSAKGRARRRTKACPTETPPQTKP